MRNRECLISRLSGPAGPGGIGAKKETTRVPERKRHLYTIFGVVLDELLTEHGITQTELGRRMIATGYPRKAPREAVSDAMLHGKNITFTLLEGICKALEITPEDRPEEWKRLWEAARVTKEEQAWPKGGYPE